VLPPLSAPHVCNYTTLSASGQEILQPSLAIFRTTDIKKTPPNATANAAPRRRKQDVHAENAKSSRQASDTRP